MIDDCNHCEIGKLGLQIVKDSIKEKTGTTFKTVITNHGDCDKCKSLKLLKDLMIEALTSNYDEGKITLEQLDENVEWFNSDEGIIALKGKLGKNILVEFYNDVENKSIIEFDV